MHLALYCFANGQLSTALKLLYRARYLMLLVCGEDHPEMALLDVSCMERLISAVCLFFLFLDLSLFNSHHPVTTQIKMVPIDSVN